MPKTQNLSQSEQKFGITCRLGSADAKTSSQFPRMATKPSIQRQSFNFNLLPKTSHIPEDSMTCARS